MDEKILSFFPPLDVVVTFLFSEGFSRLIHACKSETRDVPTNLGGTNRRAHTGTDK